MIDKDLLKRKIPDLSVIVVCFNQDITVKLILQSLLDQKTDCDYEIIITDDGSKSSMFRAVEKIAKNTKVSIKYVWQQDKGIRPTEARNNGIKIAKGKILLFLDGDMIPDRSLVERHFKAHQKSRHNLLVAGNRLWRGVINKENVSYIKQNSTQKVLGKLSSSWEIDSESIKRNKFEGKKRVEWLNSKYPWKACFSCNLSVKKSRYIFFDENYYGWGNEDWELAYRLFHKGFRPTYLKDAIAYHLESPPAITNAFRTHKQEDIIMNMRNVCYFYDKCPGLDLKDAFFGFIRFELDKKTNKWKILPRPDSYTTKELRKKVQFIRDWLKKNDIYFAKRKI